MKTTLIPIAALFFLSFSFTSCEPIEEIKEEIEDGGEFTATINGTTFSVSGLLVTGEYSELQAGVTTLAIAAAKLPLDGITEGFALALVSTDSTGIETGDEFTATSVQMVAGAEYLIQGDNQDTKALSTETNVALITVTDIDFDEKLVSGTFSFDAIDKDDPNTVYEIRDGVFTDVEFR